VVDIPEKRGQKLKIFLWPTYQKREDNSRYLCGRHTRKEGILSSRGVEMRGSIRSMIVRYSTCLTIPFCNVLTITKKRNPIKFNYTLHGHSLEHVTSAKYLGCTITSDLKWGPHINNICNKANSTISFLKRNLNIANIANKSVKERAYQSLVRPSLE
jgi:hypothetical protein